MEAGTSSDLRAVWGSGPADVFAFAGEDGVRHFDGVSWSRQTTRAGVAFDRGAGIAAFDVFSVDGRGALQHHDGVDWAPMKVPPGASGALWMGWEVGYVALEKGQLARIDRHCAPRELRCDDRWDDDCDGLLNCLDPDCVGDASCAAGGLCPPRRSVGCGATVSGSTAGGARRLERYGCSRRVWDGPEKAYRFTAAAAGEVTVTLTGPSAGLGVVVLGASASGGCDPVGACLVAAETGATREARFTAAAGATYFLLVDGADGAQGTFELQVGCP
jgi:hypothetical protein